MKKHTIVHLNAIYLKLTFIYFFIKNLRVNNHYFLAREIKKGALEKFPFERVIEPSLIFYPLWLLNKVLYLKFNFMLTGFPLAQISAIRKIGKIDLLHAHFGTEGYSALPLAKYLKVPLVVTFYGYDMSQIPKKKAWKRRYKKLFEKVSVICVEGEYMKSKMLELGCDGNKLFVCRLAIPTEQIKFSLRPEYATVLNILMCANFVEKKGYFDALDTIKKLKDTGINVNCEIIGDGPLQEQIVEKIQHLNLYEEVKLLGRKNSQEIYEISEKHHVFFHPSKFGPDGDSEGGAPTIISEMQALGLPVISTTHADIPNNIPVENHFLANEGDIDQMVEKFKQFIQSKGNWNRISDLGRKFVEENHDASSIGNKLEQLYDNLINSSETGARTINLE
jgi:colanic acid/amylovoran biosynthesis glycosyltransferase